MCSQNSSNCIAAKDSLSIRVGQDSTPNANFMEIYRNGSEFGRYLDNRWIQETVVFNYTYDVIYVSLKCS
jgi:hypothetical protein